MKDRKRSEAPPIGCHGSAQRGASLIMVLLILVVVSIVGVGGAQIALMSERGARNSRDLQIAWQGAEAALIDADIDMFNNTAASTRKVVFDGKSVSAFPAAGCGTAGNAVGLCASVDTGKPNWLVANFAASSGTLEVTEIGTFTERVFAAGSTGLQPALKPRYIIEPIVAKVGDKASPEPEVVYRVTSMGFGPRRDIQAVLQMLYRI